MSQSPQNQDPSSQSPQNQDPSSQSPQNQDASNSPDSNNFKANRREENALWTIFGYLLSGLLFWGGAGWAADRFFNTSYLTLIGLLVGMGGALYLVWLRFGRE